MRIALYDGILEKHVVDSLERALVSRGHAVYNTGKIASGFHIKSGRATIRRLEQAISNIIDFKADWVFVFRPAALPLPLIQRLKRRGIHIAAWFSDDPVLLGLSYGPLLNQYDLVLHCGHERVLAYYEQIFGRPTGVNVPFWTDREEFPVVWGNDAPVTDVMFLGNVDNPIRRHRYHDLAAMNVKVTIFGRVGDDPDSLSGGYLHTNDDILRAGSRTRTAINIPQVFSNHRGQRTWFSGLDELGFFQYPSRVIQYMAMGIPVITIAEESSAFETFPEMIVCPDTEQASHAIKELLTDDHIETLSRSTADRFDRHFSAMSRVLLFENVVASDDWKRANTRERASWFAQFDATEIAEAVDTREVEPAHRQTIDRNTGLGATHSISSAVTTASVPMLSLTSMNSDGALLKVDMIRANTSACDAALLTVWHHDTRVWESRLDELPSLLLVTWRQTREIENIRVELSESSSVPFLDAETCTIRVGRVERSLRAIAAPAGVSVFGVDDHHTDLN